MGDRSSSIFDVQPSFRFSLQKTSCVGDRIFCVFFRQKQQQAFVIIQDLSEQCQHNKAPNGRCFMNWGRETNIKLKPLNLDLSEVSNFAFFFN